MILLSNAGWNQFVIDLGWPHLRFADARGQAFFASSQSINILKLDMTPVQFDTFILTLRNGYNPALIDEIDACLVENLSDTEANQRLSIFGITRRFDVLKAHTSWEAQTTADIKLKGDLTSTWTEQQHNNLYHDTCSVCMCTG